MRHLLFPVLFLATLSLRGQQKVTPYLPGYGGIYDIPEATVLPDPDQDYKLVVDVFSPAEHPDSLAQGLYRTARMINLFAVGGVPLERLDIVLAIHGGATYATLHEDAFRERFGTDNPNLPLLRGLERLGVRITVCGQSLIGRNVATHQLAAPVEIATSMLTTVASYQMKGYGIMRF